MPRIHRDTDSRVCGAGTVVNRGINPDVYANNLLVSIDRDPNTHGGGALIARCRNVFVHNTMVVNHSPDNAYPDSVCPAGPHCNPKTASGSPNVYVGD